MGRELGSIAAAMTPVAERVDDMWTELFPDSASETLARWEAITGVPSRPGDDDSVRQARVLGVLRRVAGPRIDQLGPMLIAPLDCTLDDLVFVEQMREYITDALTVTDTTTYAITASPTEIELGQPWPGVVDDSGVRLYVELSALGTPTVTVTSPEGTVWNVTVDATSGWYETRTVFRGETAGGDWTVSVANGSSVNLTELRLLVSNDVDSAQIFNFFCFRDPALGGTPDFREARRIFARTAHGHNNAQLTESEVFIIGDPHSVVGREPLGV